MSRSYGLLWDESVRIRSIYILKFTLQEGEYGEQGNHLEATEMTEQRQEMTQLLRLH